MREKYQKAREFVIALAWQDEEGVDSPPHSQELDDGTEIQALRTRSGVAWSAMKDGTVLESGLQEKDWLETEPIAGNTERREVTEA